MEQTFIIKREVANGPVVFLERLDRHLMPTGWIELPVTGVYEVHDGRITVWHEYFDLATIRIRCPRRRTDQATGHERDAAMQLYSLNC